MPRKKLQRSESLPYHVTARANNREAFPLKLELMWEIFSHECLKMHFLFGVEIHSFVLMPNHIHMMVTVPELDLGTVMNLFMSSATRSANRLSGRSGHVFGGPYYGSLIEGSRYYGHALKYVYRNPVKAGLCDRVEDYKFSTLYGLLGLAYLPFPMFYSRAALDLGLPSPHPSQQLDWLNRAFPKEAEALIKKRMRRRWFGSVTTRLKRSHLDLLDQEL